MCLLQSGQVPTGSRTFPLDWSLKTKVRFVTSSSLSWCSLLRGSEEAHGSDAFTTCSPLATASQLHVIIITIVFVCNKVQRINKENQIILSAQHF